MDNRLEVINEYKKKQFNSIKTTLLKSSELIAFIKVYGAAYTQNYMGYILNIDNMVEQYLVSQNSKRIDDLYEVYLNLKNTEKTEREVFEKLRLVLEKLHTYEISEVESRTARHNLSERKL